MRCQAPLARPFNRTRVRTPSGLFIKIISGGWARLSLSIATKYRPWPAEPGLVSGYFHTSDFSSVASRNLRTHGCESGRSFAYGGYPGGSRPLRAFNAPRSHGNRLGLHRCRSRWAGAPKSDVLRRTDVAVCIRPYLTRRSDKHGPVQIGLRPIVDQDMRKPFALRRVHRDGWIELQHGALSGCLCRDCCESSERSEK